LITAEGTSVGALSRDFRANSGLILRGNDAGHNQGNHKGEELHVRQKRCFEKVEKGAGKWGARKTRQI
jgi:hypothetical protein